MLTDRSATILRLVAGGRSYDQILGRHPDLTYLDIFGAAREALTLLGRQPSIHPAPAAEIARRDAATAIPGELDPAHLNRIPLDEPDAPPSPGKLPSYIERAREKHPRAWARWTRDEDAQLRLLFDEGRRIAEMAQELGRHDGAIRSRLLKLELLTEDHASTPADTEPDRPVRPSRVEAPVAGSTTQTLNPVPGWDAIRSRLSGDA